MAAIVLSDCQGPRWQGWGNWSPICHSSFGPIHSTFQRLFPHQLLFLPPPFPYWMTSRARFSQGTVLSKGGRKCWRISWSWSEGALGDTLGTQSHQEGIERAMRWCARWGIPVRTAKNLKKLHQPDTIGSWQVNIVLCDDCVLNLKSAFSSCQ